MSTGHCLWRVFGHDGLAGEDGRRSARWREHLTRLSSRPSSPGVCRFRPRDRRPGRRRRYSARWRHRRVAFVSAEIGRATPVSSLSLQRRCHANIVDTQSSRSAVEADANHCHLGRFRHCGRSRDRCPMERLVIGPHGEDVPLIEGGVEKQDADGSLLIFLIRSRVYVLPANPCADRDALDLLGVGGHALKET